MAGALCIIPFLAAVLTACDAPAPVATGYVEGEFRLIAPVAIAQVAEVAVRRGQRVGPGELLARMERRDAEIALASAEAALAKARSELQDLRSGPRDEEIRVIEAELASARAEADEASREARRLESLLSRGTVPQASVDAIETRLTVARARVAEIEANLAVAKLPARDQKIAAAEAAVEMAATSRDAALWQLGKRELSAPSGGQVFEILRRTGEIAGPAAPVISFLPDGGVVLRLYVPEPQIAGLSVGSALEVNCDGCPAGTTAMVTYISDSPEFTPPVIYSLENRQKLVYLVEARPETGADALKPGQIVDVRLWSGP